MELNEAVFNAKNNTEAVDKVAEYLKQQGIKRPMGMAREIIFRAVHVYQMNFDHQKYTSA